LTGSKRGQTILDLLLVIVMLFAISIAFVLGYKVLTEVNTDIQADEDISDVAKADLNGLAVQYPQFMDNSFVLTLALLWLALIVTSFLIDSHPVFFIITVVLLVFVFLVSMILANAYQDIAADDDLSESAEGFPMMSWVFENFLIIVIAMGFSSALALYAKGKL